MNQFVIRTPADAHFPCVGWCDQSEPQYARLWFAPWFLVFNPYRFGTQACIWERNGNVITKTYRPEYNRPSGKPNAPRRVWELTDEYDKDGYRLGVWPD